MTVASRWWVYQKERFPIAAHGPLIAAMSLGALGYASAVDSTVSTPALPALLMAWAGLLGFFFLLRVADEFKDYETDCRHRPYRPVPRGLIGLRELAGAAVVVVLAQGLLASLAGREALIALILAWCWLALMTREFFVHDWLLARPLVYLVSHMLIMPLLMLYALGHHAGAVLNQPAVWILLPLALATGLCIEIGRKLRRPEDEEAGVDTYSVVWGRTAGSLAWFASVAGTLILTEYAIRLVGGPSWSLWVVTITAVLAAVVVVVYRLAPNGPAAKAFEGLSALTTLVAYLMTGVQAWMTT